MFLHGCVNVHVCSSHACVRDMYIYCMYSHLVVDTSYINHTVLEGYDCIFSFLSPNAIKLNYVWASVDVTVIQLIK